MASRKTHPHHQWARVGALTRLREIEAERAAIFAAFPDLRRQGAGAAVAVAAATGRRRTISPEGRKAMSAGMRRYWARRRAAEKKG